MTCDSCDQAGWYEIGIQGRLDERWSTWFGGMTLDTTSSGATVLRGLIVDQAALHGLLSRLRDLGLPLVSVHRVPKPDDAPTGEAESS